MWIAAGLKNKENSNNHGSRTSKQASERVYRSRISSKGASVEGGTAAQKTEGGSWPKCIEYGNVSTE